MTRNLVIARVGRNSLHEQWAAQGGSRKWDLYLCPYEEVAPTKIPNCIHGDVIPGAKWSGIVHVLQNWPMWRNYDYIWLPDDDIGSDHATISLMFDMGHALGLDLFAPALGESSYFAHYIAMRNRSFDARHVTFVEIMVPCFKRDVLERFLWTFDLSPSGWGWGLDVLWPKLLNYENLGIIDAARVYHTRPVGVTRDPETYRIINDEADRIIARFECPPRFCTLSGFDDVKRLDLEPDALLAKLIQGWNYLYKRDPRILRWVVEHHKEFMPTWSAYPPAGAPT